MSDKSKLVAAPAEVTLGDLTLVMSPLNDIDIAELNEWVRARYIANADMAAKMTNCDDKQWRAWITVAMDRALGLTWYEPPGSTLMATIEGVVRLAWQACKRNMPALTHAMLREKLMDPRNMAMFRERFARHNSVPDDGVEEVQPGKAKRPSPSKSGTRRSRHSRDTHTTR